MQVSASDFQRMIEQVMDAFPPEVEGYFDNVAVLVADRPSGEQKIFQKTGTMLLGLYEGVPRSVREGRTVLFPDRITLFQQALEKVSLDEAALKRNIAVTLWHELGHHLGFSDQRLRSLERRILEHLQEQEGIPPG